MIRVQTFCRPVCALKWQAVPSYVVSCGRRYPRVLLLTPNGELRRVSGLGAALIWRISANQLVLSTLSLQ